MSEWIVKPASGLPARFTGDKTRALQYAADRHGTLEGPMSHDDADARILALQRALLDGASPMEQHP
jgi:hypothetical protein